MILLIDNYDSFVHNLARYFQRLGQDTRVVRNDQLSVRDIQDMNPGAIVLSPGPCTPDVAGISRDVVRAFVESIPLLGVCLGHQTIAAELGGKIVRAPEPMHGRTSQVQHDGTGVFQDLPNPLTVCRYHSLVVDPATVPAVLRVTARTADGTVMALQHQSRPVIGLQFHPEAILTDRGYEMLSRFLDLATLSHDAPPDFATERKIRPSTSVLPTTPVTF